MPHFDDSGREEWVCQKGAHVCTGPSTWVEGVGNVCPRCFAPPSNAPEPPLSLYEHARRESGLSGLALVRYVNRHYGQG